MATHVMREAFVADAAHAWQLSAERGEQVTLVTDSGDGWCEVERCTGDRARGSVPTTYISPAAECTAVSSDPAAGSNGGESATHVMKEAFIADSACDWQLGADGGARVALQTDHGDGWSVVVRCDDGEEGAVPTAYLEPLPLEEPPPPPAAPRVVPQLERSARAGALFPPARDDDAVDAAGEAQDAARDTDDAPAATTHTLKQRFEGDASHAWQLLGTAAGARVAVLRDDSGDGWSEVEQCRDESRAARLFTDLSR